MAGFLLEDVVVGGGDLGVEFFSGFGFQRGEDLLFGIALHLHFFAGFDRRQDVAADRDLLAFEAFGETGAVVVFVMQRD